MTAQGWILPLAQQKSWNPPILLVASAVVMVVAYVTLRRRGAVEVADRIFLGYVAAIAMAAGVEIAREMFFIVRDHVPQNLGVAMRRTHRPPPTSSDPIAGANIFTEKSTVAFPQPAGRRMAFKGARVRLPSAPLRQLKRQPQNSPPGVPVGGETVRASTVEPSGTPNSSIRSRLPGSSVGPRGTNASRAASSSWSNTARETRSPKRVPFVIASIRCAVFTVSPMTV
jgi:hypothetical protein